MECYGQDLNIQSDSALFELLGFTFGGNGTTSFKLPDLAAVKSADGADLRYFICIHGAFPSQN